MLLSNYIEVKNFTLVPYLPATFARGKVEKYLGGFHIKPVLEMNHFSIKIIKPSLLRH